MITIVYNVNFPTYNIFDINDNNILKYLIIFRLNKYIVQTFSLCLWSKNYSDHVLNKPNPKWYLMNIFIHIL